MKKYILLLITCFPLLGLNTSPLPVPIVRQATSYSCGAASLLSVLYYWKVYSHGEQSLYESLSTTEAEGTAFVSMEKVAKSFSLTAQLKEKVTLEELSQALSRREPVIVSFQAWPDKPIASYKNHWDDGHYAVVVGMDETKIYFMDPSQGESYSFLTHSDFLDRWHDCDSLLNRKTCYQNGALFLKGKESLTQFPAPPQKIE